MLKIKEKKGLRVLFAGIICCIPLLVSLPLAAFAVEYSALATIKKGLTYPTDVAASDSGKIYVVDGLAKKVLIYNSNYQLSGSISSIENPTSVAVSGNTVFVADNKTKSVKILNSSGEVIGDLQKDGSAAVFKLPRNIAVDVSGNVYVVDQFAETIEVFDASSNHAYTISGLSMPQDAVVAGSELFIIDQPVQATNNTGGSSGSSELRLSRIRIFDLTTGAFVNDAARSFPSYGTDTETGQYISLKGIAVDPHNNLYANDSYLNALYKYDINGQFLGVIGEPVATPIGATVSADGRLVVTSSYEGTVKVIGVDYIAGMDTWDNESPVAHAGSNQTVAENTAFVLDGSLSDDTDGIVSYQWTQTSGINALPSNPYSTGSDQLELTAPTVGPEGSQLYFKLVVTDGKNKESTAAFTTVTVKNVITGSVVINNGTLYTNDPVVNLSLDAPEAVKMRFANDGEAFAPTYDAYASAKEWTLGDGDGTKVVNVEFIDAGGNTTTVSSSIILDTEQPAAPAIIDIGGMPGEFNWNPVDGAVSYNLRYASNSSFVGAENLTGLTYNGLVMELQGMAYGNWFWQVQAVDAAGNTSAWSDSVMFTVAPDCAQVPEIAELALPYDNASEIPRTAILETNDMIYPADCGVHLRTEWQISESSDFQSLVLDVGTTLDNLVTYQVPALVLEPETTYYWRVKQTASNGKQSDWSEVWSFTTEAVYDEEGQDGVLYVQPEGTPDASAEEISIKEAVGDAGISIKVIRVSSGVVAKTIKDLNPDTIPDTVNRPVSFPLGLLAFKLTVEPGAYAQVEVVFSSAAPKDADWYIYNVDEGWHAYAGAIFSRNRKSVTLNFQDGGDGDADGVANGVIVNP